MILKIKRAGIFGVHRTALHGGIDDVLIKSDLIEPTREKISIYFKGEKASGIIQLSHDEMQALIKSIKPHLKLIKKSKIMLK
ncbi:hypothetical protein J4461_01035 [Candidatus Pacearchaeota archaeon]|nr:hypothetical protein [Candidatus Pacearchaeota archaeon]